MGCGEPRFKTFVATCATRWEPGNRPPAGRRGCRRADNVTLELCPKKPVGFLVVSSFGVVDWWGMCFLTSSKVTQEGRAKPHDLGDEAADFLSEIFFV